MGAHQRARIDTPGVEERVDRLGADLLFCRVQDRGQTPGLEFEAEHLVFAECPVLEERQG